MDDSYDNEVFEEYISDAEDASSSHGDGDAAASPSENKEPTIGRRGHLVLPPLVFPKSPLPKLVRSKHWTFDLNHVISLYRICHGLTIH